MIELRTNERTNLSSVLRPVGIFQIYVGAPDKIHKFPSCFICFYIKHSYVYHMRTYQSHLLPTTQLQLQQSDNH
jgi:hypothetical protein